MTILFVQNILNFVDDQSSSKTIFLTVLFVILIFSTYFIA